MLFFSPSFILPSVSSFFLPFKLANCGVLCTFIQPIRTKSTYREITFWIGHLTPETDRILLIHGVFQPWRHNTLTKHTTNPSRTEIQRINAFQNFLTRSHAWIQHLLCASKTAEIIQKMTFVAFSLFLIQEGRNSTKSDGCKILKPNAQQVAQTSIS